MKKRMPIGAQLGVLIGTALVLMVILLGIVLYEFQETSNSYQNMLTGSVQRTMALLKAQDDFHQALSDLRGYVAYNDEKYATDTLALLNQSLDAVETFNTAATASEVKQVGEQLHTTMLSYKEDIKHTIALKQNHDASYAAVLSGTRQKTETVNTLFNDAMATQDKVLKQRISQLNERQATLFKMVIGSSVLGILAIIALDRKSVV